MAKMGEKEKKFKIDFRVGEMVKIIDGPFKDHDGKIAEINEEQGKVKIKIPVFGRETMIELDLLQVNKI